MIEPVKFATDRSMAVPPGLVVKTGYVNTDSCYMFCRDRMAVGDVDRAYQKLIQLGNHSPWPCIRGEWDGEKFKIIDGRHEFIASLMLGKAYILVAWVELHK